MHGLLNRAIQCFLVDTYGGKCWTHVARVAGVEPGGFEAMLTYEDSLTDAVLHAAVAHVGLTREMLLEDLGTYLVSHSDHEALRRLLRFGGETFLEFLFSLEDLPDRTRLAVPDLEMPELELAEDGEKGFLIQCRGGWPGAEFVLQGMLRAMADDYGALALLDVTDRRRDGATLTVSLLDATFHSGRSFSLVAGCP
ncbi:heme NO-binding domain-containing protein [Rhodovulum euryhalinum]|uniref:Heme-NO-binding protein n=1 Tax=Rhodovulum euryhalinum TaxID=35805 RepID=A0A4R2KSI1_9RHOB|nr:heme NO-binding domain-containing protein [Rhodovulum euryhalinum]TCO73976.1 heme-NO-binding protein [Rhodovulum euryhalinum]